MIDLRKNLRFWFAGTEVVKLANAAKTFWERWETWLNSVLTETDIVNCSLLSLDLHAWERGIPRLPGESEVVWRGRVRIAVTSAIHAGSRVGLEAILTAYGLQGFTVTERDPGLDWDVILIDLDPTVLSLDSDILNKVLHEWGRLCRRYSPSYSVTASVGLVPFTDQCSFMFCTAS